MSGKASSEKSVRELFEEMSYGSAAEDSSAAENWIKEHDKKFGHFINNRWERPEGRSIVNSINPCTSEFLASTIQGTKGDLDLAVAAAKSAFKKWTAQSCSERAKILYSIARHVQKHSRLLAVVEALDNGKTVRETRDCDVPLVARHFYYYAGWAKLMQTELPGCTSIGVVAAIVPWNFPLMLMTWKIAPALAMGNTVVLKPASNTRLSALLFAAICAEAGLPPGVLNVVTGNGAFGSELALHKDVVKVAFTGSTAIGKHLRQITAGTGKKLSLELGGKSPIIVFDSADLDSAVEGVVDAIWFNQGQVCSAGSRLFVQETVFEKFMDKLKRRIDNLRLGSSMDKTMDMGAVIDENQKKSIADYVNSAKLEGAEVYQGHAPEGCFYPPTLITGLGTVSKCFMEEIFGPLLIALPFRTAKEAINLANNTMYGLAASVFTEKLTLALETAKLIKAGSVWINCHNKFDAAAGFGGFKQSGFGRDGGREGLYDYVNLKGEVAKIVPPVDVDMKTFGLPYTAAGPDKEPNQQNELKNVDQTLKLYYGGAQKRPDAGYSRAIVAYDDGTTVHVGESNRKDVRNAVEAARKAQPSWEKRTGFNRSQIMYYMGENMELRKQEFSEHLVKMTGASLQEAVDEVDACIERLFHWAAYADKYGGEVQETTLSGTVVRLHEATGVIGIACPDVNPLLSFISLMAPAVCRGNAVVIVPSEDYPTAALQLYQILETSDMPAGVVNILTGSQDHLTKYLTEHHEVQAMWYFGHERGAAFVEHASSCNLKKTWVEHFERDWFDDGEGLEFLHHSTEIKNIWLPMGDIFAN